MTARSEAVKRSEGVSLVKKDSDWSTGWCLEAGTESTCSGPDCGPGIIPKETATVCIGCEGFNPVVIAPDTDGTVREAYHAENIDRLSTWLADHRATQGYVEAELRLWPFARLP